MGYNYMLKVIKKIYGKTTKEFLGCIINDNGLLTEVKAECLLGCDITI